MEWAALTRGDLSLHMGQELVACAPPDPGETPVSDDELRVLLKVPAEGWADAGQVAADVGVGEEVIGGLVEKGLIYEDGSPPGPRQELDARYRNAFWSPFAAYYHWNGKWRDVSAGGPESQALVREHAATAPDPFFDAPNPRARVSLPEFDEAGSLHEVLGRRRTCRAFEPDTPMPLADLSAVLRHTFGCGGVARSGSYPAIRKATPSGGSLHPTEAFLVVRLVEGLTSGLYHYNVRSHALDLLRETSAPEARRLILTFVAHQEYFADVQVLFLHAARVRRQTWKYRDHVKAYRVLQMDVGHLSQTLQLVCTERGLGTFFTAAMNDGNVEVEFGLDPLEFCVIGANGCGIPAATDPQAREVERYLPGEG